MSERPTQPAQLERLAELRPIVAIVGRPNVGKSTLFNRLQKARRAITDNRPGVTRDCLFAPVSWDGRRLTLVDTGGYLPGSEDSLARAVAARAEAAIREADLVLLVCDGTAPVTDLDRRLADLLLRLGRPHLLVANKLDTLESEGAAAELHGLGLGAPQPVSAATGRRSGDLLDLIVKRLDLAAASAEIVPAAQTTVVLAGRPNVGKSTLMNRLAGAQMSLVDEKPGTTRDTISVRLKWAGRQLVVMDTAGLRRRAKVEDAVEYYSSQRAADAIEHADVVVALLDATEGATAQDARIIGRAIEAGCGLIVAANKWDRIGHETAWRRFADELASRFPFLGDYPALAISAATGMGVGQCLGWIGRVADNRSTRVPTPRLNEWLQRVIREQPPLGEGRQVKVLYATQTATAPPTFALFATRPDLVNGAYRRFVEKRLRAEFDFTGTPVRMAWRDRRPG